MITILLFILGLFLLFIKRYTGVITIISVLASTYLQMNVSADSFVLKVPGFEVSDFGLVIYILFFFEVFKRNGAVWRGKLQDTVSVFLVFIALNGIFDVCVGTSIGDVIRYSRKWLYLSLVYIYPYVSRKCVLKSFRQMYYITLILCLLLLSFAVIGLNLYLFKSVGERGIKPPSFSIIFAVSALIGFFRMSFSKRILHFIVFLLPSVLNLKMTYIVSIFLMYFLYVLFQRKINFDKKFFLYVVTCASIVLLLSVNVQISQRFFAIVNNWELIEKDDGSRNFTYRLLHAAERWNYIAKDPVTLLRGIGYIQEKNYGEDVFEVGTFNKENQTVAQLDTGDIAWSLFFVRLGVLGLLLYLFAYFRISMTFYKYRKNPRFCFMFVLMLVFICFTSFGNAIITQSDFFIYPILMLNSKTKVLCVKHCRQVGQKTVFYENSTCTLGS